MTEMVVGLDPHKASNTIAVLDRAEGVVARGRFRNDDAGITEMLDTVAAHERREPHRVTRRLWPVLGFARSACLIPGDGGGVPELELDG